MGIITLIFFIVALVIIGVGIAVGLVACLLAAVLLGLGVLSTSFLVGFLTRSRAEGIRAFAVDAGKLDALIQAL